MASRRSTAGSGRPIDAADEFEIFADGQVGIKRKSLRHVAGAALDLGLLGEDVVAEAQAGPDRASAARRACGWWWSCRCRWGRESRGCGRAAPASTGSRPRPLPSKLLFRLLDVDDDVGRRHFAALRGAFPDQPAGVDRQAERQAQVVVVRPRVDAEHQLAALLQRKDHRRGEFGLLRNIDHAGLEAGGQLSQETATFAPSENLASCVSGT